MRDDFKQKTKDILRHRAGNQCSNPDCRRSTSGPNSDHNKASSIGVASHITAASTNGPRFDGDLTREERSSILNGIWLCENCAKMIDVDTGEYPVELLYQWKHSAEAVAKYRYEGREVPEELTYKGYDCTICGTFIREGNTVCLGCDSDVCYGLTPSETTESIQTSLMIGVLIGFALFVILPTFLNSKFGWDISLGFGLGPIAFGLTAAFSAILMVVKPKLENERQKKRGPRVFRKRSY